MPMDRSNAAALFQEHVRSMPKPPDEGHVVLQERKAILVLGTLAVAKSHTKISRRKNPGKVVPVFNVPSGEARLTPMGELLWNILEQAGYKPGLKAADRIQGKQWHGCVDFYAFPRENS